MSSESGILYTLGPLPSFSIWGTPLPLYFFWISLVTCLCIYALFRRSQARGQSPVIALDTAFVALVTGFIGARAFHIIFEHPALYWQRPLMIFEVWRGGFVFYGGLLMGYAGGALFLRRKKDQELLAWHDVFAPVLAGGYALGRFACYLQGCCYGKLCALPWALPLTEVHADGTHLTMRHPTPLYAVAWESLNLLLVLYIEKKFGARSMNNGAPARKGSQGPGPRLAPGQLFFLWLALHSLGRLLMESFRADPRGWEPFGLMSLSSFVSFILLFGALSFFTLKKPRT